MSSNAKQGQQMNSHPTVWVLDDDKSIRWVLDKALVRAGLQTRSFDNGEELLRHLEHTQPDVILSDIRMPGINGLELLTTLHQRFPHVPVIIMTAHSDLESAVSSYSRGAFEYLPKPFDIDEAVAMTQRALEQTREHEALLPAVTVDSGKEIIGEAPAMQEVFRAIGRLALSNITVLINGESGTGKELVAHALHRHSPRRERPFIALNVAAIPRELIESELFGHEKGAFTGASALRTGRFEQAHGGTLFLDEIGDMPADTQTRLLRVLSDGEFYRVGGTTPVRVDVRIIAATHQNLEKLVSQHLFRDDLFHRLNVIRIHVPPLRERREDIVRLGRYFLARAAEELDAEPRVLRADTEHYITGLDWPGNVRQLENFCRWITVMAPSREVRINDLPPELLAAPVDNDGGSHWTNALEEWAARQLRLGQRGILEQAGPDFERTLIRVALRHTQGRRRDAAALLGWGRNTLTRKIQEHNIDDAPTSDAEP